MITLIDRQGPRGQVQITFADGVFTMQVNGAVVATANEPGHRAVKQGQTIHVFADTIALPRAEGDTLRTAYTAWIMAQPRTITRADLVAELETLLEAQQAAFERAHDAQDANAWTIKASFGARIAAAEQALAAYDADHPRAPQPVSATVARMLRGED